MVQAASEDDLMLYDESVCDGASRGFFLLSPRRRMKRRKSRQHVGGGGGCILEDCESDIGPSSRLVSTSHTGSVNIPSSRISLVNDTSRVER